MCLPGKGIKIWINNPTDTFVIQHEPSVYLGQFERKSSEMIVKRAEKSALFLLSFLVPSHLKGMLEEFNFRWRPINDKRLTDQTFNRNIAPLMRIRRLVAVIAQDK